MTFKWIGALLIIGGCGGFGFSMARGYLRQEQQLRQLRQASQLMGWELQYRLTALPELAVMAGNACGGALKKVFLDFARELNWQTGSDARSCMQEALKKSRDIPPKIRRVLRLLGKSLGRFDLEGQLQGLEGVQEECKRQLAELGRDKPQRLRSYQTLGLCAGAALAILFA